MAEPKILTAEECESVSDLLDSVESSGDVKSHIAMVDFIPDLLATIKALRPVVDAAVATCDAPKFSDRIREWKRLMEVVQCYNKLVASADGGEDKA